MSKNTFSYRTALVAASQCLRESGNCLDAFANKCKTYGGTVVEHLPRETALNKEILTWKRSCCMCHANDR